MLISNIKYKKNGEIDGRCLKRLMNDYKRTEKHLDLLEELIKAIPSTLVKKVEIEENGGYYNIITEYDGHIVYITEDNIYKLFTDETQLIIAKNSLALCKDYNRNYDDYKKYLDIFKD